MKYVILSFIIIVASGRAQAEEWYQKLNLKQQTPNYLQCSDTTRTKDQLLVAKSCINYALKNATPEQKYLSKDEKNFALGIGNMLFVRKLLDEKTAAFEDHIIAGDYSTLTNIQSVLITKDLKEVIVFDQSKSPKILVFDIKSDGNVGPKRALRTPWMKDVTEMKLHPNGKSIVCYSPATRIYYTLENAGDSRSHAEKHGLKFTESSEEPSAK